ncbi:MAG: 5-formyltetrahydrofolate cyclo-ligase [Sporichthyaceae bacterium]
MDTAKSALRERLLSARRARLSATREEAGVAIAHAVLALPEITDSSTVAAYLSIGTEPPTMHLVEGLRSHGVRVVVPVVGDDLDLDWADYVGPDGLAQTSRGLREPAGPLLGVTAVTMADVVLVPGLAVDERGTRLGRGGGFYDRALQRVPAGRPVAVLLYDDEVLPVVPSEPHDRPVTMAVTPHRVLRFR